MDRREVKRGTKQIRSRAKASAKMAGAEALDGAARKGKQKRKSARAASSPIHEQARRRVWVERLWPEIDGGRWPAKGVLGDVFRVEADLVADGHDCLRGVLRYRRVGEESWRETPLAPIENDRYGASFALDELGIWEYCVEGWVDEFETWQRALQKKVDAGQDVDFDLEVGALMLSASAKRAAGKDRQKIEAVARVVGARRSRADTRVAAALDPRLTELVAAFADRGRAGASERVLEVEVDRKLARFSAWYELFPRSAGSNGRHGSFRDTEALLPYVAALGFDVLYLPPIHPIGRAFRKGKNNALVAEPEAPGSPWAIGSEAGGHKAIHPELGSLADLKRLLREARRHGLEIALDIAFQASPDHPYVREHPEWFKQRPDGTIQYAENPPKKYQDIYPFDFACQDWQALWHELRSIFLFWIEQGVRLFRVDNPHTKPLDFWAWCLRDLKRQHPDVLFLAEAFTRPKLMYALAKAGFSQSYTYFTWRTSRYELTSYLEELTKPERALVLRPNFWPNTPDILPEHLQWGGRAAFVARLVLAATLASNYGIYGPAFELMENLARPGSEEYLDNEKYELRSWPLDDPDSLGPLIQRVNRARRAHPALQSNDRLVFHRADNEQILCFSKHSENHDDRVLVVVNLDFHHTQSGFVEVDLGALGIGWHDVFQVHDLLSDARYVWQGARNYVELSPQVMPAHLFVIRRFARRENDFDYYS